MRILDKYIIKNVLFSYLFILILFIGLHILIDIFSILSNILENRPPAMVLIQYYLYYLPLIILRVSPLAFLMSVLYNYSNFGKNNELISMRASGISVLRTAYPAIFLAIFISCAVLFLQEKALRESQSLREAIKTQYIDKETAEHEIRNLAFSADNSIFFIETFLPKEKKLKNVIIFKQDDKGNLLGKVRSESIKYQNKEWTGYNVIEYDFESTGRLKRLPVSTPQKVISLSKEPDELTYERSMFIEFAPLRRLKEQISSLRRISPGTLLVSLQVEFHKKIAFPFSHLFLVIGSLPVALEIKKKKATFAAVGIGLLFSLLYSVMDSVSIALGKSEIIIPFLSAWLAPLFFLSVGLTGLRLMR